MDAYRALDMETLAVGCSMVSYMLVYSKGCGLRFAKTE